MEFTLKSLSAAAIPRSIDKAERYRLINQPWAAESICLDILRSEPGNQRAVHVLLLAITDQFALHPDTGELDARARGLLERLTSEYERAYYAGMISERRATAKLATGGPGAGFIAYEWMREAMEHYARAEGIRPEGNDDAVLRWNSCVRLMESRPELKPAPREREAPVTGE